MTTEPTRYEALLAVRAFFDTEEEMALAGGVKQPTVWRWLNQSKQLPPDRVLTYELLTGVSRHHLRPDIYPRGMVDGVPFDPEEPLLDLCTPIQFRRASAVDKAQGTRFEGVDRRVASL